jgi:hypothetical protein
MTPAWAQRQAELLRDCLVSPDVFQHMVERLRDFAMPYQHAHRSGASQRHVPLYLVGLLSHLDRKNAEQIAALGTSLVNSGVTLCFAQFLAVGRRAKKMFMGLRRYRKGSRLCRRCALPRRRDTPHLHQI